MLGSGPRHDIAGNSILRSQVSATGYQVQVISTRFRFGPSCTRTWSRTPVPGSRLPRPETWKYSRHPPPGAATRHL